MNLRAKTESRTLAGLQAVQTLSGLNRTCVDKEDTCVLDFRNTPAEIFKAIKPCYADTPAEPLTDAQHQIDEAALIYPDELAAFCAV